MTVAVSATVVGGVVSVTPYRWAILSGRRRSRAREHRTYTQAEWSREMLSASNSATFLVIYQLKPIDWVYKEEMEQGVPRFSHALNSPHQMEPTDCMHR